MRVNITQEQIRNSVAITDLGNGKYKIISQVTGEELIPVLDITRHKYGKDMMYYQVNYIDAENGRHRRTNLSRMVYIYFKGTIPPEWDIDHINDDTLDNRLENLRALSHADNLKKRGVGRNQYTAGCSEEYILAMREEKRMAKQKKTEQRKLRMVRNKKDIQLRQEIKALKKLEDHYNRKWKEYISKCKLTEDEAEKNEYRAIATQSHISKLKVVSTIVMKKAARKQIKQENENDKG